MSETRVLNVVRDLCGRQVRVAGTFETTGVVTDVIVHATEGHLLGFILSTRAGSEQRLAANRLSIGEQLVTSSESSFKGDDAAHWSHGVTARGELLGAGVVTDEGQFIGRVAEVRLSLPDGRVFYKVAASGVSRFFAEPFHLPGDIPHAYSASGRRLFVPATVAAEMRAPRNAKVASGTQWQYAGVPEMSRAFVARHGLSLWFALTALLLGVMWYL